MSGASVILFALVGFTVSWQTVPLIQRYLRPTGQRQLHHTHTGQISRFGGLAIAIPFILLAAIAFLVYPAPQHARQRCVIVGCSLAMFLLGFIDDARPLGAKRKLLGQILIASVVLLGDIHISTFRNPFTQVDHVLGYWGYVATVFWLVAFTNLINLIDGVDGLAAGIALMVMGLLLYVGVHSDLVLPVILTAGVCGALLGFLYYNFPPATIYLGDGGAYFLGFLIGIIAMVQSQKGTVAAALIAPLFALALPIVDVALAIVRRGFNGVPVFRPDRRHLHHRLAQAGVSRTRIVLMFYCCSLFFLLLAFAVLMSQGRWVPFLFGVGCLFLLITAGSFSFSREWFAVGKVLGNSLETRKRTRYVLALGRWLELEAERSDSPDELWSDFGFIARKLGFSAVTLSTPHGQKHWKRSSGRSLRGREIPNRMSHSLDPDSTLEFSAPTAAMELRTFELLSELAAETWLKAARRWQAVNQVPFTFRDGIPTVVEPLLFVPAPILKSDESRTA